MPTLGAGDPLRQLRRDRAACKIVVAGQDVTPAMYPRLMSVNVIDTENEVDESSVELDDRAGVNQIVWVPPLGALAYSTPNQIVLPRNGETVEISLGWPKEGWFKTFTGYSDDIISNGQKRTGRTLTIHSFAIDMLGKGKQPFQWSLGDGSTEQSLAAAMQKAADLAGYSVTVDPALASLTRKFWAANNESFMAFGTRMGDEVGGVFKMAGTQATLSNANSPVNAFGQTLTTIIAEAGLNLIAWSVHPNIARPQWSSTNQTYFNPTAAAWQTATSPVPGLVDDPTASHTERGAAADGDDAEQKARANALFSQREQGCGWVVIDGEPTAYGGAALVIQGTRPGVDGTYRMHTVEQIYNPQMGYTTRIDFHLPDYLG